MKHWRELTFEDKSVYKKRGKSHNRITSDTIYSLDIETTSLFKINGIWQPFDYSLSNEEYTTIEKASTPYIFMFGVEDEVYYGRDFMDIEKIFKMISDDYIMKVVWIHNSSFEMNFMLDFLEKYTIENMVCRDVLKPISFYIKELNITIRCSYMLTNMSLERASEEYGQFKKKSGDLDYTLPRGTTTPLTETELGYCEYDIKALFSIIDYFRTRYNHIALIPLTATSEVRLALRERLDYFYFQEKSWALVPTKDIYLKLMATFAGGYTHANALNANRVINNVYSYDIASSYPTCMLLYKYPCKPFKKYNEDRYYELKERGNHAFFFEVRFNYVKSKYYSNYISYNKIYDHESEDITVDNGRISAGKNFTIWITDVDLEIIQTNYECDFEFLQIYGAYKDYLDIRVIKYILELYSNKTSKKGIPEKEEVYRKSKAYINSLYGMSVTNPLKNGADFSIEKGWSKIDINDEEKFDKFVNETLEKQKHSFSNIFFFAVGCWVTSFARASVYLTALKIDKDLIYIDTDSIKCKNDHSDLFEEYNNNIFKKYDECVKHFRGQISIDDFMPVDSKGNKHPIGVFECETLEPLSEFKTLGAKKYCYRDLDGLHLTISGVNKKKGVVALNDDINNFKKGFTFDYNHSGKLTHIYTNEQPEFNFFDYTGKIQHSTQKHGVVLQPTTYTIGLTDSYEALIRELYSMEVRKNGK